MAGKVPPRYAAKRLEAAAVDVEGPREFDADGYGGERYVAAVAGRVAADGKIEGDSLVDLAPHIRDGKLSWQVPAGKWKIMKFTHVQAPPLRPERTTERRRRQQGLRRLVPARPSISRTTITSRPISARRSAASSTTSRRRRGDWGTELNAMLAEWKVDWKKAYVAYKFELAGEEQIAAKYQYLDAFAETWGRTMYGGMTDWCHEHGVKSIGHFMEHGVLYVHPEFCAGDMMRLQKYSDMGGDRRRVLRSSPSASESPTMPRPGRRPSSPVPSRTSSASRTTWRWSKSSARAGKTSPIRK